LLYIFSPQCGVCLSEFPTWSRIASHAQSKKYRVVALSIYSDDASQEKPGAVDWNFEALRIPSVAIQRAYRVLAVPMVIVVSREGKVEWVQYGGLSGDSINEVLSVIDGKKS
jgi:hypothetical protein